jgi:AraC-like DNA-binding protein
VSSQLLFFAVDVTAIVCSALLAVRVLASYPRLPSAQIIAAMAFGTICNVVLGRSDYRYWIDPPFRVSVGALGPFLDIVRNIGPGLLMVFCHILFVDGRRFPRWLLGLFALQLLLIEPGRSYVREYFFVATVPALLQTFFAAVALYWAFADWRNDLSETRRSSRVIAVAVIAVNVIISGLQTLLVNPDSIASYYTHVALVATYAAIPAFLLLFLSDRNVGEYLEPRRPQPIRPPAADIEDERNLAGLAALMETGRIYRRPGLTLRQLAEELGIPEYRLRKLIHDRLGFLNFNSYLHHFRIAEASEQLRDPKLRRTPILTIALSVGYQSINTFNRGFREVTGMTPSAWRGQPEQDAAPAPVKNLIPKPE